ncbi:MAG TPA: hypothetical protein VE053_03515 [Allosphingosinicella sp.]|nr:hypothetical protein [Allosphingosinicella sp.]
MSGRLWICAALSASSFPAAAAEAVQPSVEAWAACAWREVPVTAQNWVDDQKGKRVTTKPSQNPLATPSDVLNLRLSAACPNLLPKHLSQSIFSSAKNIMRSALEKAKPATLGREKPNIKAFFCEYYMDGQLALTVSSFEKSKGLDGVKPKCFRAQSDGGLIDA